MANPDSAGAPRDRISGPFGTTITTQVIGGRSLRVYESHPRNVGELLAEAQMWSERCFLVQDERRLSYADVEQLVRRGAARLQDLGLVKGDAAMLLAGNSPEWVIAFLASALAGCVSVLGNCWWSTHEVRAAVELAQPAVVLTDDWTAPRCPASRPSRPRRENDECRIAFKYLG
jgi:acyl-coenzyme A synthetase/AMP-(fatty) acid ligase